MKITKIGRQKKSSRLNIYVDKKYSFSLTESQVLEHGIKKDKELSDKNVDRLKKLSDEGKIYERLLAKACRRSHSKK